jgi:hypothetical protein
MDVEFLMKLRSTKKNVHKIRTRIHDFGNILFIMHIIF